MWNHCFIDLLCFLQLRVCHEFSLHWFLFNMFVSDSERHRKSLWWKESKGWTVGLDGSEVNLIRRCCGGTGPGLRESQILCVFKMDLTNQKFQNNLFSHLPLVVSRHANSFGFMYWSFEIFEKSLLPQSIENDICQQFSWGAPAGIVDSKVCGWSRVTRTLFLESSREFFKCHLSAIWATQ